MAEPAGWHFRAERSHYLLGWSAAAWTKEPRANASHCQRRFRMGWRTGPTKTCPKCADVVGANVCPRPGTLSDFVRSFEHAFVLCHAHQCARHMSGYWPLSLTIEPFDVGVFNQGVARLVGPTVAHALGLTRPGRRALQRVDSHAAAAHRVLVLLAHLEIVTIAARRNLTNVLVLESDVRPVSRHALSRAEVNALRDALAHEPWALLRPTGFFPDFAQWVTDRFTRRCPPRCECTPWPRQDGTRRTNQTLAPTSSPSRWCLVRAPPERSAPRVRDATTGEMLPALPDYTRRCDVKNTEAYAVHARAFPRFVAMRQAVRRGLAAVAANISLWESSRGGMRLSAARRYVVDMLDDRETFPYVDLWLPASFDTVLVLPQIVIQQIKQHEIASSVAFTRACAGRDRFTTAGRDREVVLAAVKQNAESLAYASEELKGDRDVVLAAVKQNGGALEYASEELKGDRDVVLAAVMQNGEALKYASQELQGDREILAAKRAVEQ